MNHDSTPLKSERDEMLLARPGISVEDVRWLEMGDWGTSKNGKEVPQSRKSRNQIHVAMKRLRYEIQ